MGSLVLLPMGPHSRTRLKRLSSKGSSSSKQAYSRFFPCICTTVDQVRFFSNGLSNYTTNYSYSKTYNNNCPSIGIIVLLCAILQSLENEIFQKLILLLLVIICVINVRHFFGINFLAVLCSVIIFATKSIALQMYFLSIMLFLVLVFITVFISTIRL